MKKPILVMALALTVACGSFLGFLPGKDVMTVRAAETGTVSGGDAGTEVTQLQAPTGLAWTTMYSGTRVTLVESVYNGNDSMVNPYITDTNPSVDCKYEFELYRDDELVETRSMARRNLWGKEGDEWRGTEEGGLVACYYWDEASGEAINKPLTTWFAVHKEEGIWKYRVRAVSKDGQSYSEWSAFSPEVDNRKESYMRVIMGVTGDNESSSGSESGGSGSSSSEAEDETDDTEDRNVITAAGETLNSAAEIDANASIPVVLRTPQSTVNAAVSNAVGGLKEGQKVMATVRDSACGELARQAVTNAASSVNGKVAAYLEITLDICDRDGGVVQNVEQLSAPIEFTMAAPEGIDGNQCDFAVVRLHGDGKVDILPDQDSDPATITFRTDRFSTYAVIYGNKGAFKVTGKDSVPKTGDGTIPVLPFAAAGTMCAAAAVTLRRKIKA